MDYETEIFRTYQVKRDALIPYGFVKQGNTFSLSKPMSDANLRMEITINEDGKVRAVIIDNAFEEEYTQFRMEHTGGEFVSKIKEEFIAVLSDVRTHCFTKIYFVSDQANRLAQRIKTKYGDKPAFLWEKTPDCAVFKNPSNEKWYALVMNIPGVKVHSMQDHIDILNVKLPQDQIENLLERDGFVPAYHMNKKHWITILLDESLDDDEIMTYIAESHGGIHHRDEWIVPANPKYYDVIGEFQKTDTITWNQNAHIQNGNTVYLYFGLPYSAILYQCIVVETDLLIPDDKGNMKKHMRIQRIKTYDSDQYPLSLLKQYGVKSVRGARSMPEHLNRLINQVQ